MKTRPLHTGSDSALMLDGASRTRHTVVGRAFCGFESRRSAHAYTGPLEAADGMRVGARVGTGAACKAVAFTQCGFESHPAHREKEMEHDRIRMMREQGEPAQCYPCIVQLVERSSHKRVGGGSSPLARTSCGGTVQGEPVSRFARVRSSG